MKTKFLAAAALLATSLGTSAQSNLSIYGMVDVGIRHLPNLANSESGVTGVDDASRSRLGFRGKEDLGGGMSAFFRLEHSMRVDTGTQRDPAKYFDDKSWVGLEHVRYGSVSLGRLRSPIDEMTSGSRFEAFEGFSLGAALGRFGRAEDAWDNGVYYTTPSFSGFKLGFGHRAGEGLLKSGRGLHVEYTLGALDLGLAYQVDGESTGSTKRSLGGGVSYRSEWIRLFGTYVRTQDIGASDAGVAYTATLGARVPAGPGEVRVALRKVNLEEIAGPRDARSDVDTSHVGLGYHYPVSKRTSINASVVRITRRTYTTSGALVINRKGNGAEVALRLWF